MLFSHKTHGFFVELNNYGVLLARTSAKSCPMMVEAFKICPGNDAEALGAALAEIHPKRRGGAFIHAKCGLYPAKRLVRRATLEPKRYKEDGYLNDVVNSQFRVEPEKFTLAILNPGNGADFDLGSAVDKDALFVGMANDEISEAQALLVSKGIFPDRLELTTVATLGAIGDYLQFANISTPTLVLEIDTDSTQSFILSSTGVDSTRPIPQGLNAMIPIVQKELGLKDEESARKLFYSNTFDFTGMGSVLTKKLLKELQSSIGFYEVQTGQSIGQVICTMLPSKLGWLETAIANQLGVGLLKIDYTTWLQSRGISFDGKAMAAEVDSRWLGLVSLMLTNHVTPAEKK